MNEAHTPALSRAHWLFWVYLALVAVAEYITAAVEPRGGMLLHLLLLSALLVHATVGQSSERRKLALALMLAPLIRLLSLSLPLIHFPPIARYPIVAIPLLCGAWMICRQTEISRQDLGLRRGSLSLNLLLMGGGLLLGAVEYIILRPQPLDTIVSWQGALLAVLSLTLFTGFVEELIFRGLLQSLAQQALGQWALVYVSLLFGVLHIGYLSVIDVLFVTAVGLLFAQIARWCGSITGLTLAHGLTNVTMFLIMPAVAGSLAAVAPWMIIGGAISLALALGHLRLSVDNKQTVFTVKETTA
jgi:uncharacterized protein